MSVFEEACYLSNQRWAASLPTEFEVIEFSKRHKKRMNILFDKMRRDKYHRFTKRATIALIAAILVISMTITAFAIPTSRDYIIHKFFDHSTYSVVNGEHNEVGEITIGYIPEGFEKTYEYYAEDQINFLYESQNTKDWINIKSTSLNHSASFDTEYSNYESINYNGHEYVHFSNDNESGYIWNNTQNIYIVYGTITDKELLKIMVSIS